MNPSVAHVPIVEFHDVTVAYGRRPVVWNVDLAIDAPCLFGIIGPNGAGKSTLLKAALGLVPMVGGSVRFFGAPLDRVRSRVGYVPQRETVDWDFPVNVMDVVLMGTYGRLGWFRRPGGHERRLAAESLDRVGLADMAARQIGKLSGGQQQRVFLARALAQQADIYLLDEPMAGVDVRSQESIFRVLAAQAGGTVGDRGAPRSPHGGPVVRPRGARRQAVGGHRPDRGHAHARKSPPHLRGPDRGAR